MVEQRYRPRTKVLYIGGTGRTGSTLLTRLLGEIPGWFAGGELAFFWRYSLGANGLCSCGLPVTECPLWSKALAEAEAEGAVLDAERMVALRKRCWSIHLPIMAAGPIARRRFDRLEEFPDTVASLYRGIATASGAKVIVDSSKEPHYSWILRNRTDLDVYFLHLVRDPRAVAHSWQKKRKEQGFGAGAEMDRRSTPTSALYYYVSNTAAELIWLRNGGASSDRYRLLRYEDFVENPQTAIDEIADFLGEELPWSPLRDGEFEPTLQHVAWGNPNRFDGGTIKIRRDDGWRRNRQENPGNKLRTQARERLLIGLTAAHRYGYAFSASKPMGSEATKALEGHRIAVNR